MKKLFKSGYLENFLRVWAWPPFTQKTGTDHQVTVQYCFGPFFTVGPGFLFFRG